MGCKKHNCNIIFIFSAFISGILASSAFLLHFNQNFLYPVLAISNSTTNDSTPNIDRNTSINTNNSIPTAKSVFDTGIMSLPTSVSGYIIDIPDEAHHPLNDNKTMSMKNAHFIPSNLLIPSGTAITFVHGDPNHIHSEIVKDASTGNVVWQTIPVKHPGGSDTKILSPGSYTISDKKYSPPMSGNITVQGNLHSKANDLVVGGLFVPTSSLEKYKADFASAGFQVISEYNFLSKVVQKDIAGQNTLIIYSTTIPIQNAIAKLKPIIASLPYR
jgi:plastocyanin